MLKDVLVNLSVAGRRDAACEYAISVANAFNAHLAGIAVAYDPAAPAIASGCEVMLQDGSKRSLAKRPNAQTPHLRNSRQRRGTRDFRRKHAWSMRLFAQIARDQC